MHVFVLSELTARIGVPDESARRPYAAGMAAELSIRKNTNLSFGVFIDDILPSIDAGCCEFYYDAIGRCLGYVAWALIPSALRNQVLKNGISSIYSNRYGGDCLWIAFFAAQAGVVKDVMARMRDTTFAAYASATYVRHKQGKAFGKIVARSDMTHFFSENGKPNYVGAAFTQRTEILSGCVADFQDAGMVGECLLALRHASYYRRFSLALLYRIISELTAMRQFRIYVDDANRPAGLLTWAWLSPRTIDHLSQTPLHKINPCEWNEGDILLVWHCAATEDVAARVADDLASGLFPDEQRVLLAELSRDGANTAFVDYDRRRGDGVVRQWLARIL